MRVVLDTNVLLSAVGTRGLCEALLDLLVEDPRHTIILSEHILGEFLRQYPEKFGMTSEETKFAVGFLRSVAEFVVPAGLPRDACRDQNDLPILGTLQAAGADCLVTGDQDLLSLGQFAGRPIMSPRQCYDLLR